MAVQAALDNISKCLDTLATKVDMEQMRDEVKCLTETFTEKLEGQLFDTEVKANKLESEVKSQKKLNKIATGIMKQQDRGIKQNERGEHPTAILQEVESVSVQGAREGEGDCSQLHSEGVCNLQ